MGACETLVVDIKQWNDRENCIYCRQSDLFGRFFSRLFFFTLSLYILCFQPLPLVLFYPLFLSLSRFVSSPPLPVSATFSVINSDYTSQKGDQSRQKKAMCVCVCLRLMPECKLRIQRNGRDEVYIQAKILQRNKQNKKTFVHLRNFHTHHMCCLFIYTGKKRHSHNSQSTLVQTDGIIRR